MRLSDIQPHYFPRLHYFARMLDSDVFVLRDDVQFCRNHRFPDGSRGVSHQAHTPIKGPEGPLLLGVSVKKQSGLPIHRTEVCYQQRWPTKHLNLIKQHYRSAPRLKALLPGIEALLAHPFASLAELDIATICWSLGHILGVAPRVPDDLHLEQVNEWLAASSHRLRRIELGSRTPGLGTADGDDASGRIAALCVSAGATEYLAGKTAVDAYLDHRPFRASNVDIVVQSWRCPPYTQQYSGHVNNLSILDLLLNTARPGDWMPPHQAKAPAARAAGA